MAGHSKWAQIKHKKAITDAKKGKLFSKLIREIMVASRIGAPSSDANPRLRTAVERARATGLPKDTIERAIERAAGGADTNNLQEFIYEASAVGGVAIIIEGITDNNNRTIAEIKHILAEENAKLAEPGSLLWNFEKKGIIAVTREDNPHTTDEEIELAFIDAGANDVSTQDQECVAQTHFSKREEIRNTMERHGIKVKETRFDYIPNTRIALSPERARALETLLEKLLDHDDVQNVYTNVDNFL